MEKIMTEQEFKHNVRCYTNTCTYEHIREDQEHCYDCYGDPEKCPRIHEAYLKYRKSLGIPDEMLVLMGII